MALFHIFLVAIIQGITEFLPVSSSGHLILLSKVTPLPDQGLAIDVAAHVGTLGAVVIYFWKDVRSAVVGLPRLATGQIDTEGSQLAFLLIVATVPVIIAGLLLKVSGLNEMMRSISVIGWTMILFGLVLWWADRYSGQAKTDKDWNLTDAWKLGMWQAIALIPGTSRSGITITGARRLGYARTDAAKLAMLMSIPTILASGALLSIDVATQSDITILRDGAIAAVFSFFAALVALILMMRLLRAISFTPYVVYRILLGIALLSFAYS
ncbi:undecaprenyl-diphosphate phosphatase [Shimia sp. R10_1]|uniref:undecaprenyl-diphosphate phosphatase n=1 Tax=Shimia sp. R10_1 TaxID=2821095 RepID=UPI001ADB60C3|nr:undecaprenyl-diphosphate phosphatase [Shimia sp. R10_1]MBO9473784.1 undecaprenyl-diphosphate phosphatase [Shimia sp. R10_1]